MIKYFTIVVVVGAVAALVYGADSPIEQCPGEHFDGLSDRIKVIPCSKKRCNLVKATNTTVMFKFKPSREVKTLENDVSAVLAGIPLPFLGVTGHSACAQVTRADTGEPAPCPLKPNIEYLYTNVFPIESVYPQVPLRVHWSLNDGDHKVICFEVPAVISPPKKSA